jgi:hypothetical protein
VTQEVDRDEVPPWERPGAVRRDYEDHRGPLLLVLGVYSTLCGYGGLLIHLTVLIGGLDPSCPVGLHVVALFLATPVLIGLPCGLLAYGLARGDLARIRSGFIDPSGERATARASSFSTLGVVLAVCNAVCNCVLWGWTLFSFR